MQQHQHIAGDRGPIVTGGAEIYDFIVTGAGSAGCPVAARLSESGRYRVLLLEAGGVDRNPWIHIPLGYTKTYTDPRVNWMFDSEPEKELNGRTLYQPRGKVLGGTSSINGMVYMRGTSTTMTVGASAAARAGAMTTSCPISAGRRISSVARMNFTVSAARSTSPTRCA